MTRDNASGTILTFILGVGVGAVVASLLVPKSGEELRGDIAEGLSERAKQVRRAGKDLKQRAQNLADLAKDHVQVAIEAGENSYAQAKKA